MATYTVTFCDLCNQRGEFCFDDMKRMVGPGGRLLQVISFFGDEQKALDNGWEMRDYGIVCPLCIAEEKETSQQDEESGAESGCGIAVLGDIGQKLVDKAKESAKVTDEANEGN